MMKTKGVIPINKPNGWTSFDVVNKLKHQLKPLKVGHLGTLDPMATGVLLVTVGKATKLFDLMQEKSKTYVAEFEFGYETNTLDSTGEKIGESSNIPTLEDIESVLKDFVGEIEQIPPKFSAKSVNGKRAYDLARNNVEFELKAKRVKIYGIEILSFENAKLTLKIECGSGTYIRSIGRDIGYKLNSLATMTKLERTQIGKFNVNDCIKIEEFDLEKIVPVSDILEYPKILLDDDDKRKILNGLKIKTDLTDGLYQLKDEIDTIAIVKICDFYAKMHIFMG